MEENFIKSFEIADGDGFGDIVSKTRKNSRGKLKVGLCHSLGLSGGLCSLKVE